MGSSIKDLFQLRRLTSAGHTSKQRFPKVCLYPKSYSMLNYNEFSLLRKLYVRAEVRKTDLAVIDKI